MAALNPKPYARIQYAKQETSFGSELREREPYVRPGGRQLALHTSATPLGARCETQGLIHRIRREDSDTVESNNLP